MNNYQTEQNDPKEISPQGVIVEIRAGAGGKEAALFADVLYRMYTKYAESQNWKTKLVNESKDEMGGYKEVSFKIKKRNG